MKMAVREETLVLHGLQLRYRVGGAGPVVVLLKPHRLRKSRMYELGYILCCHFTVIEIEPLGFAYSDRPDGYRYPIDEQVLAVTDRETVSEFVVWGYSFGGWLALAAARELRQVRAVVAGGCSPLQVQTEAQVRRSTHAPSREFSRWYSRFEWLYELGALRCPRLVYVGSDDAPRIRGPHGVPRTRDQLEAVGVTVKVFEGLDHHTCHAEPALSDRVVPAVLDWMDDAGG